MLFYVLYDLNTDTLKRVTEEEKTKVLSNANKVGEPTGDLGLLLEFYLTRIDGEDYYLIDDHINNFLVKVRASSDKIPQLPWEIVHAIRKTVREFSKREVEPKIVYAYGILFGYYHGRNNVAVDCINDIYGIVYHEDINVWGKTFTAELESVYKAPTNPNQDQKYLGVGIPWKNFTSLFYEMLRVFS